MADLCPIVYFNRSKHLQRLIQEHFNNEVAPLYMVEEYEEGPVYKPGALLERLHVGGSGATAAIVDELAKFRQVIQGTIPVLY